MVSHRGARSIENSIFECSLAAMRARRKLPSLAVHFFLLKIAEMASHHLQSLAHVAF
jgi:hypothetical protein